MERKTAGRNKAMELLRWSRSRMLARRKKARKGSLGRTGRIKERAPAPAKNMENKGREKIRGIEKRK